jgi:hypothetical protein
MDFEDFQLQLSLEMDGHIKEDLLKIQKDEEKYLLNIKNEKIKQDGITQKQIEDDNKKKELVIKTTRDAEIKRNVDNALLLQKQQMINDYDNLKNQLITEHNKQIKTIKTELETEKGTHNDTKQLLEKSYDDYHYTKSEYEKYISRNKNRYKTNTFDKNNGPCFDRISDICTKCYKLKCENPITAHYISGKCQLKIPCTCDAYSDYHRRYQYS